MKTTAKSSSKKSVRSMGLSKNFTGQITTNICEQKNSGTTAKAWRTREPRKRTGAQTTAEFAPNTNLTLPSQSSMSQTDATLPAQFASRMRRLQDTFMNQLKSKSLECLRTFEPTSQWQPRRFSSPVENPRYAKTSSTLFEKQKSLASATWRLIRMVFEFRKA